MKLLLAEDMEGAGCGHLGCISVPNDQVGVRIDCVSTAVALEEEVREGIALPGYARVPLFLQATSAAWATVVSVLLFLGLRRCGELILVALDGLPGELRIHLGEYTHLVKVGV